jgi:hypothetical protein
MPFYLLSGSAMNLKASTHAMKTPRSYVSVHGVVLMWGGIPTHTKLFPLRTMELFANHRESQSPISLTITI